MLVRNIRNITETSGGFRGCGLSVLDDFDRVSFGIVNLEKSRALAVLSNESWRSAAGENYALHLLKVFREKDQTAVRSIGPGRKSDGFTAFPELVSRRLTFSPRIFGSFY